MRENVGLSLGDQCQRVGHGEYGKATGPVHQESELSLQSLLCGRGGPGCCGVVWLQEAKSGVRLAPSARNSDPQSALTARCSSQGRGRTRGGPTQEAKWMGFKEMKY